MDMDWYFGWLMGMVIVIWIYQFVNYCKLVDLRDKLKEIEKKVEGLYDE